MGSEDSTGAGADQRRPASTRLARPGREGPGGRLLRALAPAIVLAIFCGALALAYFAVRVAGWQLYWAFVLAGIGLPLLWVIGSVFAPAAHPDRRCPRCHQERALVRPTRGEIVGVMCTRCDYRDDEEYIAHLEVYLGDPDPDEAGRGEGTA